MRKKLLKRLTAGALALLMLGTALPSGSDFSGLFSGSEIVASADELPSVTHDNGYGYSETIELKPENFIRHHSGIFVDNSISVDLLNVFSKGGEENWGKRFIDTVWDVPVTLYDNDGNTVVLTHEYGELSFKPDSEKSYYLVRNFVAANEGKWDYNKPDYVPDRPYRLYYTNQGGERKKINLVADDFNKIDYHIYFDKDFEKFRIFFRAVNDKSTQTGFILVQQDIGFAVYDADGNKAELTKIPLTGNYYEDKYDLYSFPAVQGYDYFVVNTKCFKCGEFAFWAPSETLDQYDIPDKIYITGTGAMYDYDYSKEAPWSDIRENIKSIEIAEGITTIGNESFKNFKNKDFTSIDIPSTVTSIGKLAFDCCSGLTSVTIPKNVVTIGEHAFGYCHNLTSFTFAEDSEITAISDGTFYGSDSLTDIILPNKLETIGKEAFYYDSGIKTITIPDTVRSIENNAFKDCTSCTDVYCLVADPNDLEWVGAGDSFIKEPSKATICHVPSGTAQAYNAKFGDANVTFVDDIGGKCGDFAHWALTDTDNDSVKDKLTIFGTGAMWDYSFSDNKAPWYDNRENIKSVEISNCITSIGNFAFINCSALTSVTIPASVAKIGEGAFYYCSALESVTIPANVTTIGNYAFTGCTACKDVYINIDNPTRLNWDGKGNEFITETPKATRCHVSKGTAAACKEKFDATVNVTFVADVNITILDSITNGTVKASKTAALSGDEIILTVTPSTGYKLKSLTVTDSANNPVEVTNYKFTMPDLDVTVSAEFELINYKVSFDKNGGTGTMADEPFTYGTAKALTANSFTRMGYTSAGWNTKANGTGTAYADKAIVNNLTATDDATVTLYAQWTLDTYTITYNLNGGTNNTANPATYDVNTATITLADPTKTGYTFVGWYDNSSFTGAVVTTIDNGSTGNKALFAKWTLDTYTITYNLDGGTNNTANPESYNVNTADITLADPTKTGYTFGGWYDNLSFTGTAVTTITKGSTGNVNLFAKWTINKYTIEFINYDHTVLQTSSVTYGETPIYTGTTPTKEETLQYIYTFKGWDKPIVAAAGNTTYKATYSSTVNKTSLNSAIKVLDCLNKTIKDDKIYKDMYEAIAKAIKQAQAVADNENATAEQVAEQTKTLNDIVEEFDAYKKLVKDFYEANKVAIIINELPEPSKVDKSDKEAIEAARAAYDALTKDQKAFLDKTQYPKKLSDDEAALAAVLKRIDTTRLAGKNRFATAAEISKASFPDGAKTVILAYGRNYADALAGVSLATAMNAPILLTNTKALPNETLEEIKRLGAKEVIILGGEVAVSKAVENELNTLGLYTERIAGATRFGTATKIAKKIQTIKNKIPEDIFFVYAFNSADALSVSAIAAVKGSPIIYLKTNGELDNATAAYLNSVKGSVKNAYIIGGSGVITDDMMKKAGNALGVEPTRVAGKNKYGTCVAVNSTFKDVLNGDSVCIATGKDFPDALAGGAFAARQKAPLFLVNNTLNDTQKDYLTQKNAHNFYVFGGTGAVSDAIVTEITALSK